jgi:Domain of unknown function (DUF4365)
VRSVSRETLILQRTASSIFLSTYTLRQISAYAPIVQENRGSEVGSSIKRPVCHPPPSNRKKNQNPQTQPRRLRHPASASPPRTKHRRKVKTRTLKTEGCGTRQDVQLSFGIERKTYDRLANSNIRILLVITNVKQNKLYFAWIKNRRHHSGATTVMIPLTPINDRTKKELRRKLTASAEFEQ